MSEVIKGLIWLLEVLAILWVSIRALRKGTNRVQTADHGGASRLGWSQVMAGIFGISACLWFFALLVTALVLFPAVPPPDVVCTRCYDQLRADVNGIMLICGFFFVILLIAKDEFLDHSLNQWWAGLSQEERDRINNPNSTTPDQEEEDCQ